MQQKNETKYYTLSLGKEGAQEIQANQVLKLDTNSHDTNGIKKIFRWIRYKNILVFQYIINLILSTYDRYRSNTTLCQVQKQMKSMKGILDNKKCLDGIMRYL